jgi:hypothetical protein
LRRALVQKILRGGLPALVVVTAGLLARADVPPDQYDPFDTGSLVITDAKTSLTWQRTPPAALMGFYGAVGYCNSLSLASLTTSTGWRLPSYKELLTLVDETPVPEYYPDPTGPDVAIYVNAFPGTPVDQPYWTSSLDPANPAQNAFDVDFKTGNGSPQNQGAPLHVRCVHD